MKKIGYWPISSALLIMIFSGGVVLAQAQQPSQPAQPSQQIKPAESVKTAPASNDAVKTGAPSQDKGSGRTEKYIIKKGDTLWDISSKKMNNPDQWPEVWSNNPEISNPHWIYPGQEIKVIRPLDKEPADKVPADKGITAQGGAGKPAGNDIGENYEEPQQLELQQMPIVSKGEVGGVGLETPEEMAGRVQVSGRLTKVEDPSVVIRHDSLASSMDVASEGEIAASPDEKIMLTTTDVVFLKFKDIKKVKVGDKFIVFDKPKEVINPKTEKTVGYEMDVAGGVKVTEITKDYAAATIFMANRPIYRGFKVLPWNNNDNFRRIPIKPATIAITGTVLDATADKKGVFGDRNLIFIDKGREHGLEEGNVMYVVRSVDGIGASKNFSEYGDLKNLPKEEVATIVVVDAKDKVSTGIVTISLKEIAVGDKVETRVQQ